MQALCCQNMGLKQPAQRRQRRAGRPHGVGHGREADRHALARVALRLAVQGLMLAEFLKQDHSQQA